MCHILAAVSEHETARYILPGMCSMIETYALRKLLQRIKRFDIIKGDVCTKRCPLFVISLAACPEPVLVNDRVSLVTSNKTTTTVEKRASCSVVLTRVKQRVDPMVAITKQVGHMQVNRPV
jgi:hypothetical protein